MIKKITVSYTDDADLDAVEGALKPLMMDAKVRKKSVPNPYKRAYIMPKSNPTNPPNDGKIKRNP